MQPRVKAKRQEMEFVLKMDVVNAHFLLMHYYKKKVDERLAEQTKDENDFNFNAEPELRGAEKKYNQYAAMVTAEIEKFRDECAAADI